MGRFTTEDFGYDFPLKQEEKTSLVASIPKSEEHNNNAPDNATQSRSSEGGAGYELYEEHHQRQQQGQEQQESYRYHPAKINRGGENFFAASDDALGGAAVNPIEFIGAFCCCITISFVIVGGILLAYVKFDGNLMLLVGSVLLVIAAGTCLLSCCALCIGTSTDGLLDSNNGGQSKADPNFNEVQVRFRRLNDRYEKGCMNAEDGLQHVRLDVVGHMKEVCIFNK